MISLKKISITILTIFASVDLYSQEYYGNKNEIEKILKNIETFSEYVMNGEQGKVAACYTIDGKAFPEKVGILEGTTKLKEYWTLPKGVKVTKHKITPSEIRIIKKYAYDYGYYHGETLRADGSTSAWKGKYVIVWKKVGKDWKIYLDIWNSVVD